MWNASDPPMVATAGIDDVQNGILLDGLLHGMFDKRVVAILKVRAP